MINDRNSVLKYALEKQLLFLYCSLLESQPPTIFNLMQETIHLTQLFNFTFNTF